jgi:hypothetical protein
VIRSFKLSVERLTKFKQTMVTRLRLGIPLGAKVIGELFFIKICEEVLPYARQQYNNDALRKRR